MAIQRQSKMGHVTTALPGELDDKYGWRGQQAACLLNNSVDS